MSSLSVVGFQDADDKWNKMLAVWNQCTELGVEVPKEVRKFLGMNIQRINPVERLT